MGEPAAIPRLAKPARGAGGQAQCRDKDARSLPPEKHVSRGGNQRVTVGLKEPIQSTQSASFSLCLCVPVVKKKLSRHRAEAFQPGIELAQGGLALLPMSLLPVPYAFFQRRQQVEGDVRRLKIAWIGMRDVMHE